MSERQLPLLYRCRRCPVIVGFFCCDLFPFEVRISERKHHHKEKRYNLSKHFLHHARHSYSKNFSRIFFV